MKKNYTYRDCYKILDADQNCSWKELRKSYKKLIHKWHPDRYDETSGRKALADEKIKSINIAYNQIQQYYRSNSALPSVTEDDPSPEKNKPQKQQPAAEARPKTRTRKQPQANTHKPESKAPKRRTFYTVIIALLSLTAFYSIYTENMGDFPSAPSERSGYGVFQEYDSHDNQKTSSRTETSSSPDSASEKPARIKAKPAKKLKYFTYGDSIGKVIGAQGVPDRTEGDIWYYGESEVHFSHGRVTHWVRKAGSPLNIHLNFDPHRTQ